MRDAGALRVKRSFAYLRSNRLLKHDSYISCYTEGRKYHTLHFIVYVKMRNDAAPWRAGIAVSKKVGKAFLRNRFKRILREFFRLTMPQLSPCADIVVVVKKLAGIALDLRLTEVELRPLFERIFRTS